MDKRSLLGVVLIFAIFLIFTWFNTPVDIESVENTVSDEEKIELQQQGQADTIQADTLSQTIVPDSMISQQMVFKFGLLAPLSKGEEESITLENDKFSVQFSSKGGEIQGIALAGFEGVAKDTAKNEIKFPVVLNNNENNAFNYIIPTTNGNISTKDLYFTPTRTDDKIIFTGDAGNGLSIIQTYQIKEGSYEIDYSVQFVGFDRLVDRNGSIVLNYENYLNKFEKNEEYERTYSTIYYKADNDGTDYCSCRDTDTEDLSQTAIKWVSSSNQFFNFTIIGEQAFKGGIMKTVVPELPESVDYLKKTAADLYLADNNLSNATYRMKIFAGPNEFELLRAYELDLEDIIPFGSSIFGTINRWIIRPIFNFMEMLFNNPGISIVFMTLLVKLLLYPLTYKMLYSQSKMSALKPRLSHLKDKFKDDAQGLQVETMKIYREHGVNPLGGCFPMLLQMPIWFALYRFFPASIDFRQAGFLWANDLSTYDEWITLPFTIPLYGEHVSLFTILWAGTTVLYTWYNSKQMTQMANMNPMMMYVQYLMPIMFIFAFNNFASGLTCYLLFSNIFNIGQTYITKNYIINEQKIIDKMEIYKKNPKKKSSFQERLEKAMAEQQKAAKNNPKKK